TDSPTMTETGRLSRVIRRNYHARAVESGKDHRTGSGRVPGRAASPLGPPHLREVRNDHRLAQAVHGELLPRSRRRVRKGHEGRRIVLANLRTGGHGRGVWDDPGHMHAALRT